MPYRNAPYYILVCIAVIVAGFWESYFSAWGHVPWQFHAHGVAASIWVLMVLAQSWTPHHDQLSLHRAVGKTSLLLFPFLIGGLAAIIDLTAKGFVAANDPVRVRFGGEIIEVLVAVPRPVPAALDRTAAAEDRAVEVRGIGEVCDPAHAP